MGDTVGRSGAPVSNDMKESFVRWMAERTGRDPVDVIQSAGSVFEQIFTGIVEAYGQVAAEDIDPKHIHLFLVS